MVDWRVGRDRLRGESRGVELNELPSGTVTFLFTDIEGSTRLWEEHPDAMRDALARHDDVVREAIEAHGGYVVKTTGDGFHAAFGTAEAGVSAAVAAQRALDGEAWSLPEPLRVRMGLHTGAASLRDGDYFGPSLNRAARLMGVAHGGQVVCSQSTTDLAREVLAEGVDFVDLGEHRLRDLARCGARLPSARTGAAVGVCASVVVGCVPGEPATASDVVHRPRTRDRPDDRGRARRAARDADRCWGCGQDAPGVAGRRRDAAGLSRGCVARRARRDT